MRLSSFMKTAGLSSSPATNTSGMSPKRSPTMMPGTMAGSTTAAQSVASVHSGTVMTSPGSPRCRFSL
jgi:hypothetical protein